MVPRYGQDGGEESCRLPTLSSSHTTQAQRSSQTHRITHLTLEGVAVDHWGPTKEGKHLLVVEDYMSRYPEVEVVTGTSASANVIAFDNIFSRRSFPKVVRSDNGAPFNGKDRHELQQYFA